MIERELYHAVMDLVSDIAKIVTFIFLLIRACDIVTWNWYIVISPIFVEIAVIFVISIIRAVRISVRREKEKRGKQKV